LGLAAAAAGVFFAAAALFAGFVGALVGLGAIIFLGVLFASTLVAVCCSAAPVAAQAGNTDAAIIQHHVAAAELLVCFVLV
jgi:hypothetical protein